MNLNRAFSKDEKYVTYKSFPQFNINVMVCIWVVQGVSLFGSVALLEEVCHFGVGFETLFLAASKTAFSWLPLEQDIELSPPSGPCLPGCCHASCFDNNCLNLRTCKPGPLIGCPYTICRSHGVSSQQQWNPELRQSEK